MFSGMTASLKFCSVATPLLQECCIRYHWHLGSVSYKIPYGLQENLGHWSSEEKKDTERETGFALFTVLSRATPNQWDHDGIHAIQEAQRNDMLILEIVFQLLRYFICGSRIFF